MLDSFKRQIDYLRVSVTDRCNFRCTYCMPPEGIPLVRHEEILTYEELLRIITLFTTVGIKKVRLTGGEPLVRKGIVEFIGRLSQIKGIEDLALTTNGSLLALLAHKLKAAGLSRVNISLDTIDAGRFHSITGRRCLEETLAGIESALAAGLTPVKLNVVLTAAVEESDIAYFINKVFSQMIDVRFIEYMSIGLCRAVPGLSISQVKDIIMKLTGKRLVPVQAACGSGPARYFTLPGAKGKFGFITPLSEHFCNYCNRLRLTADGKLKPCLLADSEIDIKTPLRSGASDEQLLVLLRQAVVAKPAGHTLGQAAGKLVKGRKMSQIGG